jgi:hypothetical protein
MVDHFPQGSKRKIKIHSQKPSSFSRIWDLISATCCPKSDAGSQGILSDFGLCGM